MVALVKLYKRKLKASSLAEVLIATVIILTIFGIAITTLDNVLFTSVRNKKKSIDTELNILVYEYEQGNIKLPYSYEEDEWKINSLKTKYNNINSVSFEAKNIVTKQIVIKKTILNDSE